MLFSYTYKVRIPAVTPNRRMALFQAKKMLPEYVFDTSQLENNPITFPEIQTLMDGITIGGRRIQDVQQVLNIKDSWFMLLNAIKENTFEVSKEMFHAVNAIIAREESLEWGTFRTGSVGIAGTRHYRAPAWQELDDIFDEEISTIFNSLMVQFYDTGEADEIVQFLAEKCVRYIEN